MAFLSCGHVPGEGPYGKHLERAVDFVLAVQKKSGFLVYGNVEPYKNYQGSWDHPRQGAHYNHAIAGIMLCEVYGMMDPDHNVKIREAVIPALEITRHYQVSHKRRPHDRGGWRYLFPNANTDSDLSVTSWQLMFMRSAKNAGFDVPAEFVDDAMGYVRRCFHKQDGVFRYSLGDDTRVTRAVNGAGILSLSLGGEHNTEMAHAAGRWLMQQSFLPYNTSGGHVDDYYHYSVYYSTLGMFQLGGEYWRKHFPPIVQILLQHQRTNGSWPPERKVAHIGSAYSTALMVMTLTAPYQLVPIYQR